MTHRPLRPDRLLRALVASLSTVALLTATIVPPASSQGTAQQQAAAQPFSTGQLEQLAAPIALYPDTLLMQVLMASTYPLDVVQAARWRKANGRLKGEQLEDALKDKPWDEAVKALTAVPEVLQMMSDRLEWTQQLGEAFLAQEQDLMTAVQDLRRRADQAGNLATTPQLRIVRASGQPIVIESAEPEVVYVPSYDPAIYGAWGYPDYPPYDWHPRRRGQGPLIWFATAVAIGTALWATWDWSRRRVVVDPARFNTFNRTARAPESWQFDPRRRRGAGFRTPALVDRFKDANVPAIRRQGARTPPPVSPRSTSVPGSATPRVPAARSATPPKGTPLPKASPDRGPRPHPSAAPTTRKPSAPVPASPKSAPVIRSAPASRPPAVRPPLSRPPVSHAPIVRSAPPRPPAVHAPVSPPPAMRSPAPRPAAPPPKPAPKKG